MSAGTRRSAALEVALVGALLLLANVGLWIGLNMGRSFTAQGDSPEHLRAIASKLASAGVKGEAVKYYERYLDGADIPDANRAQVGLVLARLLKEDGKLEESLGYLYRVEQWAPSSDSSREAAPLIVEVLERLGLGQAAQTALSSRSRLDRGENQGTEKAGEKASTGPVVAKIGGEPLTTSDLDQAIDALPPQLKEQLKDPAARKQFLQQFVAQELLYRKGLKRSLDKDPSVRRQLDELSRQIVVSRLLEEELKDKGKVDESDLRNFYEAHKAQFTDKDGKTAPLEQVLEQVKQGYMMNRLQSVSQELLAQAQSAQEVQLFPEAIEGGKSAPAGSSSANAAQGEHK